jgi:hypothetical protein
MQIILTASSPNAAAPPKLNLRFDVCACSFGGYPWDDWERFALASDLDAELAGLGRLLVREAYNHGWEAWLQNRCGWGDDGRKNRGQPIYSFVFCLTWAADSAQSEIGVNPYIPSFSV